MKIWNPGWGTVLFTVALIELSACSGQRYGPVRTSADGSRTIVYVTARVALHRYSYTGWNGETRRQYDLVEAAWLDTPELASQTGDIVVRKLVSDVRKIGRGGDFEGLFLEGLPVGRDISEGFPNPTNFVLETTGDAEGKVRELGRAEDTNQVRWTTADKWFSDLIGAAATERDK